MPGLNVFTRKFCAYALAVCALALATESVSAMSPNKRLLTLDCGQAQPELCHALVQALAETSLGGFVVRTGGHGASKPQLKGDLFVQLQMATDAKGETNVRLIWLGHGQAEWQVSTAERLSFDHNDATEKRSNDIAQRLISNSSGLAELLKKP